MKLARTVTRFSDYEEEFRLELDLNETTISASILCPIVDNIQRIAEVTVLDASVGHIKVFIKNEILQEFRFEDIYVIVNTFRLTRMFNPLNIALSVQRS